MFGFGFRLVMLKIYCISEVLMETRWSEWSNFHVTCAMPLSGFVMCGRLLLCLNFMREVLPKEWLSYRDQVTDNFRIISHHNVRILQ